MKKIKTLSILLVAAVVAASSCKKRVIPTPLELCNISEVTVTQNGSPDTSFYHLTYDREGRLSGKQTSGAAGSSTTTYAYADTNLVVKATGGGATVTDSVTLNSDGLMLIDVARSTTNDGLQTTYYYYTGAEVDFAYICIGCETPGLGPGGPDEEQYNWTDGNLSAFIPQAGFTSTTSTTYSYNSSPAAIGDYFSLTQLLSSPAPTIMTTNQVDQFFQNYGTSTIIYAHYPNGRISGMTIITGGPAMFGYGAPDTVIYSYTYGCQFVLPLEGVK